MADRKEWELTDREVFDSWRPDAPLESSQRSIATAAASKAREEERERCAKVCDEYPKRDPAEDGSGYWAAQECAAAIRRGKP